MLKERMDALAASFVPYILLRMLIITLCIAYVQS